MLAQLSWIDFFMKRLSDNKTRKASIKKALTYLCLSVVTLICVATFAQVNAQNEQPPFTRSDAMVAMRDGVRLNTRIFAPTRTGEQFPLLLLRTPYGIANSTPAQIAAALPELAAEGFIIVQQDIRGRFKSEGQFVMLRQPRDPKDKMPSTKALTLTTRLNGC